MTDETTSDATEGAETAPDSAPNSTQSQPWYYGADADTIKVAERYTSGAEAAKALAESKRATTEALQKLDDLNKRVVGDVADYGIDPAKLREALDPAVVGDPEQFDKGVKSLLGVLKDVGVARDKAQPLFDWWQGVLKDSNEQTAASLNREREAAEAELKREWAGDYDANNKALTAFMREFGDDKMLETLNTLQVEGVTLGNHPGIRRMFAKAGRALLEGSTHAGGGGDTVETLESQWADTHAKYAAAVRAGQEAQANKLFEQKLAIREQLDKAQRLRRAA